MGVMDNAVIPPGDIAYIQAIYLGIMLFAFTFTIMFGVMSVRHASDRQSLSWPLVLAAFLCSLSLFLTVTSSWAFSFESKPRFTGAFSELYFETGIPWFALFHLPYIVANLIVYHTVRVLHQPANSLRKIASLKQTFVSFSLISASVFVFLTIYFRVTNGT